MEPSLICPCRVLILFRRTLGFNPEFLSELGMTKLTNTKLKWVVRKYKKGMSIRFIAEAMNVSERRIQQIIKRYKLTKVMPILTKARRPRTEITDGQKAAIDVAFEETKLSPRLLYYEMKRRGNLVPKNKIYSYCKERGWVIPEKNKQKKRKRCRYERIHSGSLVHGDTHRTSEDHPFCLLWTDDASRKILSGIESKEPMNNQKSILSFKQAQKEAWKYNVLIRQANTDRGPEFFSNKKEKNKDSKSEFEIYLEDQGIDHIPSRIKNPQTNGKLERLWKDYGKNITNTGGDSKV